MKNIKLLFWICIIFSNITACSKNVDGELLLSRVISKQLGEQLKSTLVESLQSEGPISAISVCNIDAPIISNTLSENNDLEVGRTSLKTRNSVNQPDAWETNQLQWFESQIASGVDVMSLEIHEVLTEDNKEVFRYMKAIPVQEPCALCHGKNIPPDVRDKIASLYPEDQAIGYGVGELRGAFTVKIEL
ncbi:MAG: DUF3365 domain-containing protein [Gammaproteobacteria bacterium]